MRLNRYPAAETESYLRMRVRDFGVKVADVESGPIHRALEAHRARSGELVFCTAFYPISDVMNLGAKWDPYQTYAWTGPLHESSEVNPYGCMLFRKALDFSFREYARRVSN